jgi:hypothetical protein
MRHESFEIEFKYFEFQWDMNFFHAHVSCLMSHLLFKGTYF